MRQIPKELMTPIKVKDPDEIIEEKERRMILLKEHLGITDEATDTEFLKLVIDAVFMRIDQRGGQKGLRIEPALSNLKRLVKISICNQRGRTKNQEEAAQLYGMKSSTFKGLREKYKEQWKYIQEKMSGYAENEQETRKTSEEYLEKAKAKKKRLADHREKLIGEKDNLTAQEIDQSAVLDDQILLYEILILEMEDLCRQLQDIIEIDGEKIISELAEQHFVVPQ